MLKTRLEEMKAKSSGRIPAETLATMQRAKDALAASGILDRTIKVGDIMPNFSLSNSAGTLVDFAELRRQGPVLISIYRGVW